jgi:putative peptidoglycan lipid II flippase
MLILPGVLFVCLFGICSGLLHCEKYFFLTSVAPVAYNAIWLIAVWGFRNEQMDAAAIGLSLAISLAFFCQWCMTVPKTVFSLREHLSWKECLQPRFFSSDVRNMLSSLSFGIVGVAAVQINTAIDAVFARVASLEGPAYLNYAIHLQQLPLALFGIALSSALLPPLSRAFQTEDHKLSKTLLESSVSHVLFLIIPCTAGIFALGRVSINLLFGRGDFTPISSLHTTECLLGYGLGLIPTVLALLFAPAFYAKKDFWTPTIASLLSILLNFILNFLFVKVFHFGPSSLAYSTSFAALVNALLLYFRLPIRATFFYSARKPAICSIIACGISILCDHVFFRHNPFPIQFKDQLLQFFVLFTIFGGFFILMVRKEIVIIFGERS